MIGYSPSDWKSFSIVIYNKQGSKQKVIPISAVHAVATDSIGAKFLQHMLLEGTWKGNYTVLLQEVVAICCLAL